MKLCTGTNNFDFAKSVLFAVLSNFRFDQFLFFLQDNNKNFGAKTQSHHMKRSKYLNKVEVQAFAVQMAGARIVSSGQLAG